MERLIRNGFLVQDVDSVIYAPKTFPYDGVCAFDTFPLIHIKDDACRNLTERQGKIREGGLIRLLHFISDRTLLEEYLTACKRHGINVRTLLIESEYSAETYDGDPGALLCMGYECCPLPIDEQVISDMDWTHLFENEKAILNQNGLFDRYEDALAFQMRYNALAAQGQIGDGIENTYIMKVYELDTIRRSVGGVEKVWEKKNEFE